MPFAGKRSFDEFTLIGLVFVTLNLCGGAAGDGSTTTILPNGETVYFDQDTINRFQEEDILPKPLRRVGEEFRFCRKITYITHSRIFSWKTPLVYDSMATDEPSGTRGVVRSCRDFADATAWAIQGLLQKLVIDELLDVCQIPAFPDHVTSVDCRQNTGANCSDTCTFSCDSPGYVLMGSRVITCQARGTLSGDMPSCKVSTCTVPKHPSYLHSTSSQCKSGLQVAYGDSCEYECDPKYVLNGEAVATCLANGVWSQHTPNCTATDYGEMTSARTSGGLTTSDHGGHTRSVKTPSTGPTLPRSVTTLLHTTPTDSSDASSPKFNYVYLAFVSVPLALFILVAVGVTLVLRRRTHQYQPLDNTAYDPENEASNEQSYIYPDVDGLYRHAHVLPANPTEKQLDPNENYRMDSEVKGYIFILNNNNFPCGKFREGSEIDVDNVQHVFKEIGYQPIIHTDLTAQRIRTALKELIGKVKCEHTSVVLVIMSHGEEAGILGIDLNLVTMKEIKAMFSGRNCPALISKPKIIFVQACRGVNVTRSATDTDYSKSKDLTDVHEDFLWSNRSTDCRPDPDEITLETDSSVPDNADMYIAHATSEGYYSLRDRVKGSWFIQALCEELLARCHLDDLDTIMTKVSRRVQNRKAMIKIRGREHPALQTPQTIKQGIWKQIYLLPKYPPTDSHVTPEEDATTVA